MIKTNIKMRVTPEQSKKVQEICFKNGINWSVSAKKDVIDTGGTFLYIEDTITHDVFCTDNVNEAREFERFFKEWDLQEVDADLFIRANGTFIEKKSCKIENEALKMPNEFKVRVNKEDSQNKHYKTQKIDTIARCKANMTLEQQKAICIFQIDRYTHREKGQNLSDIKKIRDYLDWLEEIEKELENER